MKKSPLILLMAILLILAFGIRTRYFADKPTVSDVVPGEYETPTVPQENPNEPDVKVIVEHLKIPWELVFTDAKNFLLTERDGTLSKVSLDQNAKAVIQKIEGVKHIGEGGLLGLAIDPEFETNHKIYLYSTFTQDNKLRNRVESYVLSDNKLSDRKVLIDNIKGSSNHDGGRIAFGPDKLLYVTTGDAEEPNLAQDTNSVNGKILRINTDGSFPADNPFGNAVYSYGHRNAQGLTWDEKGNLWASEHGPSGLQTGNDEVNLIQKGFNYGWPNIKGTATKSGMQTPLIESGAKNTWAPGQIVYYQNNLFFAGLRGRAIYQVRIDNDKLTDLEEHFKNEFGRIRTITIGPDGFFYILTSNTDGRGKAAKEDDRVIRIYPKVFSR
jgi:glucose/arabinose dehydrogenase